MKIPALLSKLGDACRRALGQVFGNVSWQPPEWFNRTGDRWNRVNQSHPHLIAPVIIALFLLCCGAAWTWNWYEHRPKPHRVTVKVQPIELTKLEKDLKFPRLLLYFSEPAARLEDLHKPVTQGVRLEPSLRGEWRWSAEDILAFQPAEDWPADQKFRIIFDKKFFPRHILMERLDYEAQTPPFAIAIKQLQLYQDPANATQRQVTATLELTHAVEPGELEKKIQLLMLGGSPVFPPAESPPHFAITYGLHNRLAYLRSSPVTLPEKEDFMKLLVSKGVRTAQGGAETKDAMEDKIKIPSNSTAFQIESIAGTVARTKNGEPEQVLIVSTSADISTKDLAKAAKVWLLPKRKAEAGAEDSETETADESADSNASENANSEDTDSEEGSEERTGKESSRWQSPTDVPDDIIDQARQIEITAIPSEKAQDRQHAFRIRVETEGELYIRIAKGVRALGDYPLTEDYNAVVAVPELPREVQIEGQGGLLALNGERTFQHSGIRSLEFT